MEELTRPPITRMGSAVASGQTLDYSIAEPAQGSPGDRRSSLLPARYNPGLAARKGVRVATQTVRLHRWDEIALEKVTEMISRKIVTGEREMVGQVYLKKGALVPVHSHESEQMTYVLQGALKFLINGEEITVREGEVLHIPSWVEHQAEALDDTFELDLFSPIRQDWLDHTDSYFHNR
jgi:quercetin dioxygenase-like cupin family protein